MFVSCVMFAFIKEHILFDARDKATLLPPKIV